MSRLETTGEGVPMFARFQTVHQSVEKLDEMAEIARKQLPEACKLQGFKGFYYLVDRDHGNAVVLSFWETKDDLRQAEADAGREHTEAEAGVDSPASEIFEVALQAS